MPLGSCVTTAGLTLSIYVKNTSKELKFCSPHICCFLISLQCFCLLPEVIKTYRPINKSEDEHETDVCTPSDISQIAKKDTLVFGFAAFGKITYVIM